MPKFPLSCLQGHNSQSLVYAVPNSQSLGSQTTTPNRWSTRPQLLVPWSTRSQHPVTDLPDQNSQSLIYQATSPWYQSLIYQATTPGHWSTRSKQLLPVTVLPGHNQQSLVYHATSQSLPYQAKTPMFYQVTASSHLSKSSQLQVTGRPIPG